VSERVERVCGRAKCVYKKSPKIISLEMDVMIKKKHRETFLRRLHEKRRK
jgi:hypothetical protein